MTANLLITQLRFCNKNRRDLRRHDEYAVADDCQIDYERKVRILATNKHEKTRNKIKFSGSFVFVRG